jgi:Bifunctional DNA primase/polymerase, N-terminal
MLDNIAQATVVLTQVIPERTPPMINNALAWVDRGFAVFPLKPSDKIPLGALVPHGVKDASRDRVVIRDWWRRVPRANIGVATGAGFFVLDLDGPGAVQWFTNSCGRHGVAARSLTVKTMRGWHLFFSTGSPVPCSIGKIAPKVDIRGEGGYVVAAPSIHPDGPIYTIVRELPIAEAPRWLVDLAMPDSVEPVQCDAPAWTPPKTQAAIGAQFLGLLKFVATSPEGERNARTYWGACRARDLISAGAISPHSVEELIIDASSRAGLPRVEAARTVASAMKGARHG